MAVHGDKSGMIQGLTSATFPLALPLLPSAAKISIGFHNVVGVSQSPFTKSRQVFEWPGETLSATVELPPMKKGLARAWVAFLALLRGQSGTFLLGDTSQPFPQGSVVTLHGGPFVAADQSAGAKQFLVAGWAPSARKVLRSGDWIQVGTGATQRLHLNLLDVDADAGGQTLLNVYPRVRAEGVRQNQQVVVNNPQGLFALASNDQGYSVDSALVYGISFAAVEAI